MQWIFVRSRCFSELLVNSNFKVAINPIINGCVPSHECALIVQSILLKSANQGVSSWLHVFREALSSVTSKKKKKNSTFYKNKIIYLVG